MNAPHPKLSTLAEPAALRLVRPSQPASPQRFREVLGHYPTGVTVVTALDADGRPAGMAVGSFTSVSLEPLLVAFFPDRASSTFRTIQAAGAFCVNVLSASQEPLCRNFATKKADKFAGLAWAPAPSSGAPVLDGVLAWIDCRIQAVHEAGDHYIVVGAVEHMDTGILDHTGTGALAAPLLFHRGGYGHAAALPAAPTLRSA